MDVEVGKVLLMFFMDVINQLFGSDVFVFGMEYNGSIVGIVGVNVVIVLVLYVLVVYLDVSLNVFQQMVQVNGVVGIGQGVGDQNIVLLFWICLCYGVFEFFFRVGVVWLEMGIDDIF